MTDMPNRRVTTTLMLLTTVIITGLNLYLLYDAITGILRDRGSVTATREEQRRLDVSRAV
jgi:hypothetical protein